MYVCLILISMYRSKDNVDIYLRSEKKKEHIRCWKYRTLHLGNISMLILSLECVLSAQCCQCLWFVPPDFLLMLCCSYKSLNCKHCMFLFVLVLFLVRPILLVPLDYPFNFLLRLCCQFIKKGICNVALVFVRYCTHFDTAKHCYFNYFGFSTLICKLKHCRALST